MNQVIPSQHSKKREFWGRMVARTTGLSNREKTSFCNSQGFSIYSLGYWERKLKTESTVGRGVISSKFVEVQVSPSPAPSGRGHLPDPEWVAEVLMAMMSRRRQ